MLGVRLVFPLKIYLTGRVTIETPDGVVEASALPGRQGRMAFVILALAPRRLDREHVADVIWDGEVPAAWEPSLAAIMSKLRRILGQLGLDSSEVLQASDGSYELRLPTGSWVDLRAATNALDRAEGAMKRGEARSAWSDATVASAILRRSFLAGEHGTWVEQQRRDIHEKQVRVYDVLSAVWMALDDPAAALHAARRLVDLAPYRETAHCRLMEAHLAGGNRGEALGAYRRLEDLLADTLGISPGVDAQALYERAIR